MRGLLSAENDLCELCVRFLHSDFRGLRAPRLLTAGGKSELQQKVAALKQSLAQNQQALHQYTWTEKMGTIFKGETKSTKSQCKYDPDGIVQKTALDLLNLRPRKKGE